MTGQIKAQIKIGETVAVMVVFFFLVIFGMSFYGAIEKSNLEKTKEKYDQLHILQLSQKAAYLPELQCSVFGVTYDNCFDVYKVIAFNKKINTDDDFFFDYYDVFKTSTITLNESYPDDSHGYMIYNHTPDGQGGIGLVDYMPVSLFNASTGRYSMGVLTIKYWVQR